MSPNRVGEGLSKHPGHPPAPWRAQGPTFWLAVCVLLQKASSMDAPKSRFPGSQARLPQASPCGQPESLPLQSKPCPPV